VRASSLALLLVAGCWSSHAREERDASLDAPRDARAPDVPPEVPDGGRDAPEPLDAPACDVDPDDTVVTVCAVSGSGALPAMRPFSLLLRWTACRCETGRTCRVSVEDGVVDVRTESCREDVACDDCSFETTCEVPALALGTYRLLVDGVDAAEVAVTPEPAGVSRPACWELPAAPDAALVCPPGRVTDVRPARLCWRSVEDVGTNVAFSLTSTCRSCFDWTGGCRVVRDGARLRVEPTLRSCECPTCGACAEVCTAVEVACRSPALRDGDYEVVLQEGDVATTAGTLVVRDVSGPGPEVCVER
jgi:hypothetical protein